MKDLKANGVVTCGGGTYDAVDLQGVINVSDAVVCDTFNLEGVSKIKGDLQARTVKIAGTCKIEGGLKAERIDAYGVLSLTENLAGEEIDIEGALDVAGGINADTFSLLMSHGSGAREVCGQTCKVKKGKGSALLGILRARKHEFVCESIECDDIYLEHCSVESVRGFRVTIGPKCKIGSLDYGETYSAHDTAKIDKISKRGEKG